MNSAIGIVHAINRTVDGLYEVTCGTILDSIDAASTNWRFVTCEWCLREASASATLARMPTVSSTPELDEAMGIITGEYPPELSNGSAPLGSDY